MHHMSLSAGTKLGPYEIFAPIGAGGMGDVYRAHDSRLNRDVAIKVSAQKFSERFEREAKVIASLNHPNICHLYDVGPNYLVMELVEGETLAARIKKGAIPLEESLAIAKQMADAIEAAHEKGITHRDLKPGNVMLRPNGTVKVLDFGLAKVGGTPTGDPEHSPTISLGMTEAGVILGTAGYMAPEQARGKDVDRRADVWAFGVVLYEMLTGKRLFQGETVADTLAAVLARDPDLDLVPAKVRPLLKMCLEKDPQKRLRHIGDVMALVDASGVGLPPATTPKPNARRWLWPSVAVAGLLIVGSALAYWAPWRGTASLRAIRFEIPSTEQLGFIPGGFPAVSPDGRWVIFPATGGDHVTRMYLRALDSVEVRPLAGTESTNGLPPPVSWSPDSRFIVFGSTPGPFVPGQLKKLDISGGPAQTICDTPAAVPGVAWNREGVIVFAHNNNTQGLLRVAAAGGVATPMTVLDAKRDETAHRFPQFLPDGRHFLYLRVSRSPEYTGVYVGSIDTKPEEQSLKPLLITDRQAKYAVSPSGGTGHLLFLRDTTLFAQTFDPGRLELSGDPVPVADQVGSFAAAQAGLYSVSETGVLAYRVGLSGNGGVQLTWMDTQGKVVGTLGERGSYSNLAISPDGQRVATSQLSSQRGDTNIWILDVARGTNTRLTFNTGRDDFAVWSPDGKSVIFASNRAGHLDIYQKPADGSGEERLLLKSEEDKRPRSWSRDGRYLLYENADPKMQADLWVLPLTGDRKPIPLLRTPFAEAEGRISPDGRWFAYRSNESGTPEVYVRPFSPDPGGGTGGGAKWMVSRGGGAFPRWRGDGKELFYLGLNSRMMAVDVTTNQTFQAGLPRELFGLALLSAPDVTADGKRFMIQALEGTGATTQPPFTVVLNWQAALKK
jgi:eukaryotic-like serine/threonine-protein kinase